MVKDCTIRNVTRADFRTMLARLIFAALILIQGSGAFADDSTAHFGAGGIEFLKNEDIHMLEEVLEISTKLIRVKFRFLNDSEEDIHTIVAFPLPPYPPSYLDGRSGTSNPKTVMETFKVWVNGHPESPRISRKAVVGDHDITAELRELGLSDKQIFEGADPTEDQQAAWEKLDEKKRALLQSNWKVSETAFWQQTFPAGREIVVEHEYAPAVGIQYTVPYAQGGGTTLERIPDADAACIDEMTGRGIEKRIQAQVAKGTKQAFVTSRDVEYILGTGRNWKGSIIEFKLRIKKDRPDQIVSLCFPGKPTKVSPTVLEFVQTEFVPDDKLVVYFYTVGPQVQP